MLGQLRPSDLLLKVQCLSPSSASRPTEHLLEIVHEGIVCPDALGELGPTHPEYLHQRVVKAVLRFGVPFGF